MKLLDILQSYEFEDLCFEKNLNDEEVRCDEADSYYCMVTSQWCTLYNTLSDEQKKMADIYFETFDEYNTLNSQKEFRRGFKMAVKLMAECMS